MRRPGQLPERGGQVPRISTGVTWLGGLENGRVLDVEHEPCELLLVQERVHSDARDDPGVAFECPPHECSLAEGSITEIDHGSFAEYSHRDLILAALVDRVRDLEYLSECTRTRLGEGLHDHTDGGDL